MAQQIIKSVKVTDDVTGIEIEDGNFVHVALTLDTGEDRKLVELDLAPSSYDELLKVLDIYLTKGTVTSGRSLQAKATGDSEYNTKVREYAAEVTKNGEQTYDYADEKLSNPGPRGRVPQAWKNAYDAYVARSAMIDAADAAKASENGVATEDVKPSAKPAAPKAAKK
jgi:hypothetical protein